MQQKPDDTPVPGPAHNIRKQATVSAFLLFFTVAHFAHHLLNTLPPPLMPLIREEFGLDYAQLGFALSSFNLTYGVSQLPAGWLSDRIGPRILIAAGICGAALAGIGIGLSPSYVILIALLLLMGVFGGSYHPSAPPLISAAVKPENRGKVLGFHAMGGSASYFVGPLAAAAISVIWGWRASFVILSIPIFIFGIVFYLLLKRFSKPANAPIGKPVPNAPEQVKIEDKKLLITFMVMSSAAQAMIIAVMAFVPVVMVDRFSIAKEAAAAFISIFYFAALVASPLGGYLADRFGSTRVLPVSCFFVGPIIYLFSLSPYGLAFGALLVILGGIWAVNMPTSETYIVSHTPERRRSSLIGIMYFSNFEGGALLIIALGYMMEKFGFTTSFLVFGGFAFIITIVCGVLLRSLKHVHREPAVLK